MPCPLPLLEPAPRTKTLQLSHIKLSSTKKKNHNRSLFTVGEVTGIILILLQLAVLQLASRPCYSKIQHFFLLLSAVHQSELNKKILAITLLWWTRLLANLTKWLFSLKNYCCDNNCTPESCTVTLTLNKKFIFLTDLVLLTSNRSYSLSHDTAGKGTANYTCHVCLGPE